MMHQLFRNFMDDYATYHRDTRNKLTHYFGIPMIVLAIVAWLRYVHLFQVGGVMVNLAMALIVVLGLFYMALNLIDGVGMVLAFVIMYLIAPSVPNAVLIALFVGGWALQFLGHHFEGQKPAFFKNALHLLIGPLWILNELCLSLKLPVYKPS